MAAPPLLLLDGIRFTLGNVPLLTGAALSVSPGERLALVGRNGSGKSTLLRIAAGELEPEDGTRFLQPGATLRYLPQEPDLSGHATVEDYVLAGLGPADDPHRARALLEGLGLTGSEGTARLSGGEARRAALARALAPQPDILLLDEPTNHLDLPAIEWLEAELASLRGALVLISHDRRFLSRLSRATLWLDRGMTRRLDRGFGDFEAWREEQLELEEQAAHKLGRQIAREEHWLRHGVSARRKRNMRRVGELHALRQARRDRIKPTGTVQMQAAEASASGQLVIAAEGVAKAWGERRVVRDFATRIIKGDRIGIVGANGAGKTTLLNILTGQLAPDAGTVKLGSNIAMATLDQMRGALDPNRTLADTLTEGRGDQVWVGGKPRHVIGYMQDFLFIPDQARTPVGKLSGGERGRLLLARALAAPSNLLVLDEPTNDLDLETLDLLEEMLGDYGGTVLLVSHDRDFLDRVCTGIIMAEGEGRWQDYAGGYSDMLAQRGEGVAARAVAKPAREAPAARPAASAPAAPAKKMSFKDQHALATLPATMEKLQKEIGVLRNWLADPELYARDPKGFTQRTEALAEREAALAAAEEEWLRLEMLREELEGSA
ncbi:ATP-binding cassette domain-containing protein [Roseococcus sp. SDR]|uniref:ABC-F family ATP-binding cassette domain-containing protein n=1 Tax=Roseococcus sp. SDR TaxID=2835532 RepID=UPI001BCECBA0|nr:ATP-binding cassette domain-containing protein [Roseococcus sp. SDR]MBS7792089.1 ATP-binding cassette domain-containing protein [Roseococcus sp. SDR]MBV1847403.1 ATP-binding cassette domain-containing protein [Roseococcus sp. SDR]